MTRPLRILIVASEVAPLVSSGELGRSVGGLAEALKSLGIDVRVVIPKYREITSSVYGIVRLVPKMKIRSVNRFGNTAIFRDELPGDVPVYLIEKDKYFDRDGLYGDADGEYEDNAERFGFFNLVALEMFMQTGFYPDVIHGHDWHTGLIPAYLKTVFQQDPLYAPIATVFSIHNLLYTGSFARDALGIIGLPDSVYSEEGLEFQGAMSFLKSGLVYADILTTESKRYSQEIQTDEFGRGFQALFQARSKDLYGVINGVDYKQYDPRVDPFIVTNYTKDEIEKKQDCKQDLLDLCGFQGNRDLPIVGMAAPLDEEKGIDLVSGALAEIAAMPLRFVFLHDGTHHDPRYVAELSRFAAEHPDTIWCQFEPDEALKHKIMAGADVWLMPSKSEPCGVSQMYALKYGTIPLVRATGGLDDTIVDFVPESGKGTGFKFADYAPQALILKLNEVLDVYQNTLVWDLLQANAMRVNYSWLYSAKKYVDLYRLAMSRMKLTTASSK